MVKHGTQLLTLVCVLLDQYGTGTLVMIHAVEVEFLILAVDNVFVQLETGTEDLVSFVQILKSGRPRNWCVFVLMATGMERLVLSAQPTKSGTQPP